MIDSVAVCSRSFSANEFLVEKLNSKFSNVKLNSKGDKLEGESLIEFAQGYQAIIVGLEEITEKIILNLKELKLISKYGVGIDRIDLEALKKNNVQLRFEPGINKRAVSELTLALILNMLRDTNQLHKDVLAGLWKQNKGRELSNCNVGIVGFGNIGKDLCDLIKPFSCNISYFDLQFSEAKYNNQAVKKNSLDEIFKNSDVISIHLPLNDNTKNLITEKYLSIMKPNAILINTSRGNIVNEKDLYDALSRNSIAGAAFDVLAAEPPENFELIKLNNFFVTPHIGSSTLETIEKMGLAAINCITDK